jgi:hypothetical protein
MRTNLIRIASAVVFCGGMVIGLSAEEKEPVKQPPGNPWSASRISGLSLPFTDEELKPLFEEKMKEAEAWKKTYAFESLAPRLAYEREYRPTTPPAIGDAAERSLVEIEKEVENSNWNLRARTLEMLHTLKTEEFVQKAGFGISRLPRPNMERLESYPAEPVDLVKLPPLSAEEATYAPTTTLAGDDPNADAVATVRKLPTRKDMLFGHSQAQREFAGLWNFGLVKSVDRVSGFQPHAFTSLQLGPFDAAQNRPANDQYMTQAMFWQVPRLELVSLLKHDTPRVYLSEHLPRMEELSSKTAPTRKLNAFETGALKLLRNGEEIQTSSTPNRIEMLGAIRASKQCMQCHDVPRGTLLGAFSYEFRRDPPIKLVPTTPVVQ